MPRSAAGSPTSLPSMVIEPPVQVSKPATMRIKVDFPQPEGPITLMNSRLRTSKLTLFSARTGPCALSNWRDTADKLMTTGCLRISAKRRDTSSVWCR
jgi:hypothetical protein